ncbi:MAG: LicD family protein [Bacteroidaceae bacterium]|nr:LicD family protein [Bacteroidaceae bacterium]
MRKLSPEETKEVQDILFGIMCTFKEICDAENLWYSLAFGTMLGAVRENGFISWDDDIDVYMMLPDREKFRRAFEKRHPEGLVLMKCYQDRNYTKSHDKICYTLSQKYNIQLDIYTLFGAPSDMRQQTGFRRRAHFADHLFRAKYNKLRDSAPKNKPFLLFVKFVDLFIPDRLISRIFASIESKYDFDKADYLTSIVGAPTYRRCYHKRIFSETVDHVFNGEMFRIPIGWDEYLTLTYGDYMTPRR